MRIDVNLFVRSSLLALGAFTTLGCAGAGPYGHSARYSQLSEEKGWEAKSREYDPVISKRFVDEWKQTPVRFFAYVTGRTVGKDHLPLVEVEMRRLEPRNYCHEPNDESTCRVTVSDRSFEKIRVLSLKLSADDDAGETPIAPGSLLRIVGDLIDNDDEGGTQIRAKYYRHWPSKYYYTSSTGRK